MLRESFLKQCSRNVFMILFLLEHYHNVKKKHSENNIFGTLGYFDEC